MLASEAAEKVGGCLALFHHSVRMMSALDTLTNLRPRVFRKHLFLSERVKTAITRQFLHYLDQRSPAMPCHLSDDTGSGWLVFDDNDCLGSDFLKAPRQRQHGSDGNADPADTGAAFGAPLVFEGDRLAVKVIPGGAAVAGTLHVWLTN